MCGPRFSIALRNWCSTQAISNETSRYCIWKSCEPTLECSCIGGGAASSPQKSWFIKYLGKILDHPGKNDAQRCLTSKMAPKVCRKSHEDLFWRSHQKRSSWSLREKICRQKVIQNPFSQVWSNLGKNPSHLQKCICSNTYVRVVELLRNFASTRQFNISVRLVRVNQCSFNEEASLAIYHLGTPSAKISRTNSIRWFQNS